MGKKKVTGRSKAKKLKQTALPSGGAAAPPVFPKCGVCGLSGTRFSDVEAARDSNDIRVCKACTAEHINPQVDELLLMFRLDELTAWLLLLRLQINAPVLELPQLVLVIKHKSLLLKKGKPSTQFQKWATARNDIYMHFSTWAKELEETCGRAGGKTGELISEFVQIAKTFNPEENAVLVEMGTNLLSDDKASASDKITRLIIEPIWKMAEALGPVMERNDTLRARRNEFSVDSFVDNAAELIPFFDKLLADAVTKSGAPVLDTICDKVKAADKVDSTFMWKTRKWANTGARDFFEFLRFALRPCEINAMCQVIKLQFGSMIPDSICDLEYLLHFAASANIPEGDPIHAASAATPDHAECAEGPPGCRIIHFFTPLAKTTVRMMAWLFETTKRLEGHQPKLYLLGQTRIMALHFIANYARFAPDSITQFSSELHFLFDNLAVETQVEIAERLYAKYKQLIIMSSFIVGESRTTFGKPEYPLSGDAMHVLLREFKLVDASDLGACERRTERLLKEIVWCASFISESIEMDADTQNITEVGKLKYDLEIFDNFPDECWGAEEGNSSNGRRSGNEPFVVSMYKFLEDLSSSVAMAFDHTNPDQCTFIQGYVSGHTFCAESYTRRNCRDAMTHEALLCASSPHPALAFDAKLFSYACSPNVFPVSKDDYVAQSKAVPPGLQSGLAQLIQLCCRVDCTPVKADAVFGATILYLIRNSGMAHALIYRHGALVHAKGDFYPGRTGVGVHPAILLWDVLKPVIEKLKAHTAKATDMVFKRNVTRLFNCVKTRLWASTSDDQDDLWIKAVYETDSLPPLAFEDRGSPIEALKTIKDRRVAISKPPLSAEEIAQQQAIAKTEADAQFAAALVRAEREAKMRTNPHHQTRPVQSKPEKSADQIRKGVTPTIMKPQTIDVYSTAENKWIRYIATQETIPNITDIIKQNIANLEPNLHPEHVTEFLNPRAATGSASAVPVGGGRQNGVVQSDVAYFAKKLKAPVTDKSTLIHATGGGKVRMLAGSGGEHQLSLFGYKTETEKEINYIVIALYRHDTEYKFIGAYKRFDYPKGQIKWGFKLGASFLDTRRREPTAAAAADAAMADLGMVPL